MFDLFSAYLLIILLLLAGNLGLFLSDLKISKIKFILTSVVIAIIIFVLTFFSSNFKANLPFLSDNLGWLFIIIAIILFISQYTYLKNKNYLKRNIIITIAIVLITTFLISSQFRNVDLLNSTLFSVSFLIVMLILIPISDLLHYAKRDYSIIVGEFISLEALLIFIFGLTFWSVKNLNYEMFSSFLILTPTYKLVYILIVVIVIMIIGFYYKDIKLKKR